MNVNRVLFSFLQKKALEASLEAEAKQMVGPVRSVAGVKRKRKEMAVAFSDVLRNSPKDSTRPKLYAAVNALLTQMEQTFRDRGIMEDPEPSDTSSSPEVTLPSFTHPRAKEVDLVMKNISYTLNQAAQGVAPHYENLRKDWYHLLEIHREMNNSYSERALNKAREQMSLIGRAFDMLNNATK